MNKIILGETQLQALLNIKKFIKSSDTSFTLNGYAGTGKSLLVKYIIEYLIDNWIPYVLCAPTHTAKVVLENFTGEEGVTLHKLLSLSPNLEIIDLDFKDLQFSLKTKLNSIPLNGVVLCDEASMINDPLHDLLITKCRNVGTKVIFIGDKAQLRPVNANYHSKVFENENVFTLDTIYRQSFDSGLATVLPTLRTSIIEHFEEAFGNEGSLHCYSNAKDFLIEALPHFKKAIETGNTLETKLIAYTNNRVNAFNLKMKELLHGEEEYSKTGFLTAYDNFEFNKTKFWNSMNYSIVDVPVETNVYIPGFKILPGYALTLYNASNKYNEKIFILKRDIPNDYLNDLAYHIENTRLDAIAAKNSRNRSSGRKWAEYYKIMGSFSTPVGLYYNNRLIRKKSFDYGYAMTAHKSQGSSINHVFIDMHNINQCIDQEELRQLQYVAVSRTRKNAYILQK